MISGLFIKTACCGMNHLWVTGEDNSYAYRMKKFKIDISYTKKS